MKPQTQADALAHALRDFPRESCGLVIVERGREAYVPCRNLSPAADQFALDPHDYAAAEDRGEIIAVVHSHPNAGPDPSQADIASCEASGLEWHIVGLPTQRWTSIRPTGASIPLVGREWSHGVLDCYGLIRDYYRQECGVTLPDFYRADKWWERGENLYMENFDKAGFVRVDTEKDFSLRQHDILLLQVASPVPNHGAVFVGDGTIIHHLYGRLSSRDVYGGYYQKHTTHVIRHFGNTSG